MITSRLGRRLRSAVRRPARKLLTPGPPTVELLHPVGPQVPDDRHVQQVLDLCIRIGKVLLSSGEGSGETTETMLRVADAFGLAAADGRSPRPRSIRSTSRYTLASRVRSSPRWVTRRIDVIGVAAIPR